MIDMELVHKNIDDVVAILNKFYSEGGRDIISSKMFRLLVEIKNEINSSEEVWRCIKNKEAAAAVRELHKLIRIPHYRAEFDSDVYLALIRNYIDNVGIELDVINEKMAGIENKLSEKELAYDDLIQAVVNTKMGADFLRNRNSTDTSNGEILSFIDAVNIINSLDEQLQRYIEMEEIPFGAIDWPGESDCAALKRKIDTLENEIKCERQRRRELQLQVLDWCSRITADIV